MREKQTNFTNLLKAFLTPDETETTFGQEIKKNSLGLSEKDKQMLIETLQRVNDLGEELFNQPSHKKPRKPSIGHTKSKQDKSKQNEISENHIKTEKELDER